MADDEMNVTFFVWGDTHFGYEQQFAASDFRWGIIEQMNQLPGWPYPPGIDGHVGEPDFIVHLGDVVDGEGRDDLELSYYQYFIRHLRAPHYEVIGNHDESAAFSHYFENRWGGRSYSFDLAGLHCISLYGRFDIYERGEIPQTPLDFLRQDLAKLDRDQPVVLFVHSRLDRLKNGEDVLALLLGHRVLLIASAHIHRPSVFELEGISCLDIGHCRNHPIDTEIGRNFYVVRISEGLLTALPWRWDLGDWERGQRWGSSSATVQGRFTLKRRI